jgi:DNA-binding NarL/FixJ family response regulator
LTAYAGFKEAEHLLATYLAALAAFHDCQAPLLRDVPPDQAEFEKVQKLREEAFLRLSRSRGRYWRHVEMHLSRDEGSECMGAAPSTRADNLGMGGKPTARELEVLQLICDGLSTREIAAALRIRFKTASAHRASLMEKSGARKAVHLYRWALRQGYVPLGEYDAPSQTRPEPSG